MAKAARLLSPHVGKGCGEQRPTGLGPPWHRVPPAQGVPEGQVLLVPALSRFLQARPTAGQVSPAGAYHQGHNAGHCPISPVPPPATRSRSPSY